LPFLWGCVSCWFAALRGGASSLSALRGSGRFHRSLPPAGSRASVEMEPRRRDHERFQDLMLIALSPEFVGDSTMTSPADRLRLPETAPSSLRVDRSSESIPALLEWSPDGAARVSFGGFDFDATTDPEDSDDGDHRSHFEECLHPAAGLDRFDGVAASTTNYNRLYRCRYTCHIYSGFTFHSTPVII
jgi:hypothetical protein